MTKEERERQLLEESTPADAKVIKFLLCDLSLDEQRERGLQLANFAQEIETLEADLKRVTGEIKAHILEAKTKYGVTKNAVLTRREHRDVNCTEYFDYKRGQVYVVRDDMMLITETRMMTPTERQRALPGVVKGDKGEDKTKTSSKATKGRAAGAGAQV